MNIQAAAPIKKNTIWNRDYILMMAANLAQSLGFQIMMPTIPLYAESMGAVESQIGFLAAIMGVASLLIRPFTGPMADRTNRKKVLILCFLVTAAAVVAQAFAPTIAILIVLRFVQGAAMGIVMTVAMVTLIRTLPEDRIGEGIGYYSITTIGTQTVAPAIGLAIVNQLGYSYLFFITAGIFILSTVFIILLHPQEVINKEPIERKKFSISTAFAVEAIPIAVLTMLFFLGTVVVGNFLVIFAMGRGITEIAYFFTIQVAVLVVVRVSTSKLIDSVPYTRIILPCLLCCFVAFFLISRAQSFAPLAIAAVLLGVGFGCGNPTLQTAVVRSVEPSRQGLASSTYFLGMDFSMLFGSLIFGFVAQGFSYGDAFFVFCLPYLACIPYLFVLNRRLPAKDKIPD